MAIQPIDLQALFTQVDKVGKTQSAQREGVAMHQDIQGVQLQRKMEEHVQQVNETQNAGDDGAEKVKDKGAGQEDSGKGSKKNAQQQPRPSKPDGASPFISDPRLGRNIDISL